MKRQWQQILLYCILTYVAAGLAYSITGDIYLWIIGKEAVFSPVLGMALDIVGWPWMVYADLKHIGVKPQDIAAFLPIVALLINLFSKKKPK